MYDYIRQSRIAHMLTRRGQPDEVRNERKRRIAAARAQGKMTNQQRFTTAA
jgi:hypothetical protein